MNARLHGIMLNYLMEWQLPIRIQHVRCATTGQIFCKGYGSLLSRLSPPPEKLLKVCETVPLFSRPSNCRRTILVLKRPGNGVEKLLKLSENVGSFFAVVCPAAIMFGEYS